MLTQGLFTCLEISLSPAYLKWGQGAEGLRSDRPADSTNTSQQKETTLSSDYSEDIGRYVR
jgi:hypothetical protein